MPTPRRADSVRPPLTGLHGLTGLARLTGLTLLLAGLVGCSDEPSPAATGSATPGPSTTGSSSPSSPSTPSSSPGSPDASATSSRATDPSATPGSGTTTAKAPRTSATTDSATCTTLKAARVSRLLRTPVAAGIPDRRTGMEGRRQMDGCSYTGAGGIQLGYLIWQVAVAGNQELVQQGLPPATTGVRTFRPDLGVTSAGAVVTTGPVATAQINAVVRKRLIQVSATAKTPAVARSAATAVAAELLG